MKEKREQVKKLEQILGYVTRTGMCSPETREYIECYLALYAKLDEIEQDTNDILIMMQGFDYKIEEDEREYNRAISEYEDKIYDTGTHISSIKAYTLAEDQVKKYKRKKEILEQRLAELAEEKQQILSQLPATPEEEEKSIDEIMAQIERTIIERKKQFDAFRKGLTGEKSTDPKTTGSGSSGFGE